MLFLNNFVPRRLICCPVSWIHYSFQLLMELIMQTITKKPVNSVLNWLQDDLIKFKVAFKPQVQTAPGLYTFKF